MKLRYKFDSYLAELVFKALSEVFEDKGWVGIHPCKKKQLYAMKFVSYDTPYSFYFYPDHIEVVEKGTKKVLDSHNYENVYIFDSYLETSRVKLNKTWEIKRDNQYRRGREKIY